MKLVKVQYVEKSPLWESTHVFELIVDTQFNTISPRPAAVDVLVEEITAWCVSEEIEGVEHHRGEPVKQGYRDQYRNDCPDYFAMKDDRTAFAFKLRWC